ncbi:MAG: ExbD/TolR family protein [Bdellovibrionales bacterium]|nr:ExbD/TolR family protein [Bdellovibrionales bacterium]
MNPNQHNNGNRHSGGRTSLSEINVTPFVDVMLVLLIVFMVSAPLMQQGIEVNLPKANTGSLPQSEDPVVLSIRGDQSIHIDDKAYNVDTARARLNALSVGKPNIQVVVQADEKIPYGFVAKIMAMVKKARINRVGLMTAPDMTE